MTQSNGNQPDKIDILIDQVGRLTEEVTVGFRETRETIQAGFTELKEISQRQEQNISRLADTVARQAEIVEMLIRDAPLERLRLRRNGGHEP